MYHYVRDTERTLFPRIKARRIDEFRRQLDYVSAEFEVIGLDELMRSLRGETTLSSRACLLTFDDGLKDHVVSVLPELANRNIRGCFAVVGSATVDRKMLDVQKIQFILAATDDPGELLAEVEEETGVTGTAHHGNRFDDSATARVKALLQYDLPSADRRNLVARLFAERVSTDEAAFASSLYLDVEEVRTLVREGMTIIGHGWEHSFLSEADREVQEAEIRRSRDFLVSVDPRAVRDGWAFSYPWGDWNETLVGMLRRFGARVGFTTEPRVVADGSDPMLLPRLDTNDLPH